MFSALIGNYCRGKMLNKLPLDSVLHKPSK